jgi:DNA-directed RNA polymerase subunit N
MESLLPVRCFTCGKVLAHEEQYVSRMKAGEKSGDLLDDFGYKRFCCRRMYAGYIPELDEMLKLYTPGEIQLPQCHSEIITTSRRDGNSTS